MRTTNPQFFKAENHMCVHRRRKYLTIIKSAILKRDQQEKDKKKSHQVKEETKRTERGGTGRTVTANLLTQFSLEARFGSCPHN